MNSKIFFIGLLLLTLCFKLSAQIDNQNDTSTTVLQHYGFDKHKLFAGGSINLGYGGGTVSTFAIGALPEIGYTFKQWLDIGFAFNINYYSSTEYDDPNNVYFNGMYVNDIVGEKATSYGAGIFARVHPFEQFFFQVQPEFDMYKIKLTERGVSQTSSPSFTSILAGIGWGQRIVGESSFFTLLMFDLGNEKNTPYKDSQGNVIPVLRAGLNWYF